MEATRRIKNGIYHAVRYKNKGNRSIIGNYTYIGLFRYGSEYRYAQSKLCAMKISDRTAINVCNIMDAEEVLQLVYKDNKQMSKKSIYTRQRNHF